MLQRFPRVRIVQWNSERTGGDPHPPVAKSRQRQPPHGLDEFLRGGIEIGQELKYRVVLAGSIEGL